jgi:acyl-coenzyme A thioesterase PaaI-like protein
MGVTVNEELVEIEEDEALQALSAATRSLCERVRTTGAPVETLKEVQEVVERAANLLKPHVVPGPYAQAVYREGSGQTGQGQDPMEFFPFSPLIGRSNPVAPPVQFRVEDGVVHGRVTFGALYCGAPDLVHGGVVAAVMDELLGVANVVNGRGAMTGTLTIRYLKPTPLFEEIRMEGRSQEQDGRKIYAEGRFWSGDDLLAEAHGTFIEVRSRMGAPV